MKPATACPCYHKPIRLPPQQRKDRHTEATALSPCCPIPILPCLHARQAIGSGHCYTALNQPKSSPSITLPHPPALPFYIPSRHSPLLCRHLRGSHRFGFSETFTLTAATAAALSMLIAPPRPGILTGFRAHYHNNNSGPDGIDRPEEEGGLDEPSFTSPNIWTGDQSGLQARLSAMEANSFSSCRAAAGSLPTFSLPPPTSDVPSMASSPSFGLLSCASLTSSPGASDGLSPSLSSVHTASSQGSQAHSMQYTYSAPVQGGWPTPSAPAPVDPYAHSPYAHSRPPSNSSYYAASTTPQHPTFPSYAPNGVQSHPSPTTAAAAAAPHRGMGSLSNPGMGPPHGSYRTYNAYSHMPPVMNAPVMSAQMSVMSGMAMAPYAHHPMMYGHHHQTQPQSDRPFKCDQCTQSFSRNHDLKRHKRIHLAVKPFPCTFCPKSFSRKDALKVCPPGPGLGPGVSLTVSRRDIDWSRAAITRQTKMVAGMGTEEELTPVVGDAVRPNRGPAGEGGKASTGAFLFV